MGQPPGLQLRVQLERESGSAQAQCSVGLRAWTLSQALVLEDFVDWGELEESMLHFGVLPVSMLTMFISKMWPRTL